MRQPGSPEDKFVCNQARERKRYDMSIFYACIFLNNFNFYTKFNCGIWTKNCSQKMILYLYFLIIANEKIETNKLKKLHIKILFILSGI